MNWCVGKWLRDLRPGAGDPSRRRMTMMIAAIAIFSTASAASAGAADAGAGHDEPAADAPAASAAQPAPRPLRARAQGSLEPRVDALAKALQLDARQRAELLAILDGQRLSVRKIWSDPKLSSAERVPATRAVADRTADQIRSILNDDQKKKYNLPKPSSSPSPGDTRSVEQWLDATRQKE